MITGPIFPTISVKVDEDAVSITFDQKVDDRLTGSSVVGVKYQIESLSKFRHDMIK